jgi:hypothetical protein
MLSIIRRFHEERTKERQTTEQCLNIIQFIEDSEEKEINKETVSEDKQQMNNV